MHTRMSPNNRGYVVLSAEEVAVERHLRRLARSRSYRQQRTLVRSSLNLKTGEVRERARRSGVRVVHYRQGAGFQVVNDGSVTGRDLARVVAAVAGTVEARTHVRRPGLVVG